MVKVVTAGARKTGYRRRRAGNTPVVIDETADIKTRCGVNP